MAYKPYEDSRLEPTKASTEQDLVDMLALNFEDFNAKDFEETLENLYQHGATPTQELLHHISGLIAQGHPLNIHITGTKGLSNSEKREKEKKERHTNTANLVILADINADIDAQIKEINEQIAEKRAQIDANEAEITRLTAENVKIREKINTIKRVEEAPLIQKLEQLQEKIDLCTNEIIVNTDMLDSLKSKLDTQTQQSLDNYIATGNDIITVMHGDGDERHIVYKDAEGNPVINVDGTEISVINSTELKRIEMQENQGQKFGNDLSQDQINTFTLAQNKFLDAIKDLNGAETDQSLPQLYAAGEIFAYEKALYENERNNIQEKLDIVQAKIAALENQHGANSAKIEKLEAENTKLQSEIDNLEATKGTLIATKEQNLSASYTQWTEILQEKAQDVEIAEKKYEIAVATSAKLNQSVEFITEGTRGYEDRHEFLKENYGDSWRAKLGKKLMGNHTGKVLAVFAPKEVKEAWKNSLKDDDGNFVYRDNDTGKLYHLELDEKGKPLKDENGDVVRTYYDDKQASELYKDAWHGKGQFFRNETPHSADPKNHFDHSEAAMLKTADLKSRLEDAQEEMDNAKNQSAEALADAKLNLELAKLEAAAGGVDVQSVLGEEKEYDQAPDNNHEKDLESAPNMKESFQIVSADPSLAPKHAEPSAQDNTLTSLTQ